MSLSLANPTAVDAVTVTANIQDLSGVSEVILQYKIGSEDWSNVTMTLSGDIWSGVIPAHDLGVSVTYRIVAVDIAGNEAISDDLFILKQ